MKKMLGLSVSLPAMFFAGMYFEKLTSVTSVNLSAEIDVQKTTASVDKTMLNNEPFIAPSQLASESCEAKDDSSTAEFNINRSSLEAVKHYIASAKPSTEQIISLYVKANDDDIQEVLSNSLTNNLAKQSIELGSLLIEDSNPKARQLAYELLGGYDTQDTEIASQLIDASYVETNTKAKQKIIEAMANTCAFARQELARQCSDRLIEIVQYSDDELASNSLLLLSRMPITDSSIALFSEKLLSDIPAQRFTALDGLFNAKTIDSLTLNVIRNIASNENESLNMRELANELLRHFEKS